MLSWCIFSMFSRFVYCLWKSILQSKIITKSSWIIKLAWLISRQWNQTNFGFWVSVWVRNPNPKLFGFSELNFGKFEVFIHQRVLRVWKSKITTNIGWIIKVCWINKEVGRTRYRLLCLPHIFNSLNGRIMAILTEST